MRWVLDASVVISWLMPDERLQADRELLKKLLQSDSLVSGVWPLEIAHSLTKAMRNHRIGDTDIQDARALIRELAPEIADVPLSASTQLLELTMRHQLTAYDASYLALAMRHMLPLVTLDRRLADAAKAEGVPVEGIASS